MKVLKTIVCLFVLSLIWYTVHCALSTPHTTKDAVVLIGFACLLSSAYLVVPFELLGQKLDRHSWLASCVPNAEQQEAHLAATRRLAIGFNVGLVTLSAVGGGGAIAFITAATW